MLHYAPQHVSSSTLFIIRRTNCITTAYGIVTLCKQPCSMRVESGLTALSWYFEKSVCLCVLCGSQNQQPLFPYTTLTDWFV